MLKRSYLTVAWLLLPFYTLFAQLITTSPAVPTADQPVTITFDATQGTAGLQNCNCDVYLHTGVITNQSTSPSDWKYVQTTWGVANNAWKLTPVPGEPNKYTYTFGPTVRDYYDPAIGETIEQLAMVFRNANGTLEGKGTGGTDIFVDVAAGGNELSTSLMGDPGEPWPLGLALPISGGATQNATLVIFDNNVQVATFSGTSFSYDLVMTTPGQHDIRLEATTTGGATATSSFTVMAELQAIFTSPTQEVVQASNGQTITFTGTAYVAANLVLRENGVQIAAGTTTLSHPVTFSGNGADLYTLEATYQGVTASDQVTVIIGAPETANPPAGFDRGITRTADGLFLQLYAPGKSDIFVIGNFNNWQPTPAARMKRSVNGEIFWVELTDLPADEDVIFQYLVDYSIRVADPHSELVLDKFNDAFISDDVFAGIPDYPSATTDGIVSWVRMNEPVFNWTDSDFTPVPIKEQTIYELLLRDFLADHSYASLLDTLDYLDRLGITTIELMPVNEFEGNISWGYNPSFHMALDKYYGSPEDFKAFVDACHERGISVFLDVVYNHAFSQSPLAQLWWNPASFRPAADNPYLNQVATHPFSVGYDFNHESPATRDYVKTTLRYWIEEFHIDGFRFDLSKGFTQRMSTDDGVFRQYDAQRIATIKEYADQVWAVDNDAVVILEHFAESSEENELAQYGNKMYFWSGFNPHDQYLEASMGYPSNLSSALAQNRGFTDNSLVAYMESHDEERLMYKNEQFGNSSGSYDVRNISTGLDRVELASVFFYSIAGPKMLWQFGELGYGFSINQCPNGGISNDCRTDPKPIRWDYREEDDRRKLYNVTSALLFLRNNYDVFHAQPFNTILSGSGKRIHLDGNDLDAAILGNFGVTPQTIPNPFPSAGTWYDYFGQTSIEVTNPSASITLQPGQYFVYLSEEVELPGQGLPVRTTDLVGASYFQMQALPNPSNGQLFLDYQLNTSARVELTLIDAFGRTIANVFSGERSAGRQREAISVAIPAGMYFLRLNAGGKVGTTRVVIR